MNVSSKSDINAPLAMTGVQRLHKKGIKGKGIKIAVIDTGIDYLHPAFGGGFGPGFKVAGGYDFVGDDFDPTQSDKPATPDSDPLVTCVGRRSRNSRFLVSAA